jgi:glucosamine--fructose-6-phosphate aminotransferase (isomerizing)
LAALALKAAQQRGHLSGKDLAKRIDDLRNLPGLLNQAIALEPSIKSVARKVATAQDVLFLGRGPMYPLAMEGALKLKEISYIHAEGYASGELKHGPIALIDKKVPVVIMAPTDDLFDKTISNMQEVMARGGKVVLITDAKGAEVASDGVWQTIVMPTIDPFLAPILYAVPAQLLSYHAAVAKGTDVDQPRNLAKSVTVE